MTTLYSFLSTYQDDVLTISEGTMRPQDLFDKINTFADVCGIYNLKMPLASCDWNDSQDWVDFCDWVSDNIPEEWSFNESEFDGADVSFIRRTIYE